METAELEVGGMHCSACATRIQKRLSRMPEVASASVNLATSRAFVSFDPSRVDVEGLCRTVTSIGYTASPLAGASRPSEGGSDHWAVRAAISWPLALAALAKSLAAPEAVSTGWFLLAAALAVEVIGGWPFVRNAARLARHRGTNMDTLIALGTLAAVGVTGVITVALDGRHIHLGPGGAVVASIHGVMAPLIVAMLATGRAVEARARARATDAMRSLLALRPPTARLIRSPEDDVGELVAPETVPVGALLRVGPSETIPLDGEVVEGWSAVDESMLTGEPFPIERGPGATVTGGTRNGEGSLVVRVGAVASESVLARLERLVEDAQRDKAPLQLVADRISAVFVPVVLLGSLATFLGWWLTTGSLGQAALSALSVLLVACPCAMGLAAPVAMMVGCGKASALGIFVRSGDALERLARVDAVVFDKTGTLTERHATIRSVTPGAGCTADEVLALAAAVEAESDHPVALAIRSACPAPPTAAGIRTIPGTGVSGMVGERSVEVGRLRAGESPAGLAPAVEECLGRGETVVSVRRDGTMIGAIALATPLRPEAGEAVSGLKRMGLTMSVLSGDGPTAVRTAATTAGIAEAAGGLSPAGKAETVTRMRAAGRVVVMVGDGVNDTPALAAADVGCAIGSGSEAALANSDVALLRHDLRGVPEAVALARATYSVILQNFAWAAGYNISALPLAAAGLLDPVVAAFAMGLSSVVVVLNSLRLTRFAISSGPVRGGHRRRSIAASILLPMVLFAGLTVTGQAVSPARGESLLPTLPSLTIVPLTDGGSVETYFEPGGTGPNQWHVIFYGNRERLATVLPRVVASHDGGPPRLLRGLRVAAGHYTEFVDLQPGTWVFHVQSLYGHASVSFSVRRVVR